MAENRKIGFLTKYLSNRHYVSEVSVEGKESSKFHFTTGHFDRYVNQIIRTGNCITLLSTKFTITEELFWNTNHFEDFAKYVFWTFNKSFLLRLIEGIVTKKLPTLRRCQELLNENTIAYTYPIPDTADEELLFCYMKNDNMKRDPKFQGMYTLDGQNRKAFLLAVEKRIAEFPHPLPHSEVESASIPEEPAEPPASSPRQVLFLEVLTPMDGGPETTLQFIKDKTEQADFDFDIFSTITRLPNGKNPYGLNGAMGAMIDFFYQHKYYKKEYGLEEIFKAYLQYSGNTIGKLHTFLSDFREDKSYLKHFAKLKALKINKLS